MQLPKDINEYLRLCCGPHKRRYVAIESMWCTLMEVPSCHQQKRFQDNISLVRRRARGAQCSWHRGLRRTWNNQRFLRNCISLGSCFHVDFVKVPGSQAASAFALMLKSVSA